MTKNEERKLLAIMFTDMVGYSQLTQRNEALALKLLKVHHRMLRPVIKRFNGAEIKTIGDAFLLTFESTLNAVRCAVVMQEKLRKYNEKSDKDEQIKIRIGIHVGDVVLRDNDVFGDNVNIASRLEPLAETGGITISESVKVQVWNKIDNQLTHLGVHQLKNITQPVNAHKVNMSWEIDEDSDDFDNFKRHDISADNTSDHFELLEKIGSGGMGVVYKARDIRLDRIVALKFLSQTLTSDKESIERLQIEAKSAAALNHPNIVTIYEIGKLKDQLYIAMEFVEGKTLRNLVGDKELATGNLVDLAIQVSDGLSKAHKAGIIHRDIKPENIMIDSEGRVKIMDFGLAKLKGARNLTKETTALGTINYMSPEQTAGGEVDHRTDIWSLGVLLYELLSGERPFKGEYDQAVIYSILNEDPPEIKGLKDDISADFYGIIQKMLVKDVNKRLQSCEEVITEFKEIDALNKRESSQKTATGLSQLWGKKMLKIAFVYVLASVALTSFVGWLSDQILLSPYLTDFLLISSLSMFPTVLILTWQGKKSNAVKWTKNTGISLNLVIVIGVLGFLFYGKDLGYTHESVTFTDDEGKVVNKVIPKGQFRKTVAIFPIENVSGDSTYNWLQNGIAYVLWFELMQDLYVKSDIGYDQNNKPQIESDGFPDGIKMPLSYQRKISKSLYKDYFLTGNFDLKDGTYLIDMTLFKTENMKKITQRRVSGSDIFSLIDEMSVIVRRDLGIPEKHIEQNEDWPVSELFTNSMEAAESIMKGLNIFFYDYDHKKALPYYLKGLEIDSTIAGAYVHVAMIYDMLGEYELRDKAADKMMKYIYRLQNLMQLYAKNNYYRYKGDKKKQVKVAEMHVELYPEDYQAREHLANLYIQEGKIDLAIAQYSHLMGGTSDEGEILNRIGRTFRRTGKYEKAMDFYLQYIQKSPDDYRAYEGLAITYWDLGELDEAVLQYEKALLIEPNNLRLKLDRLWLDYDLGNHESLEGDLTGLLKQSDSYDSRNQVYEYLERLYSQKGQIKKIIDFWPKYLSEYKESSDYAEVIYFMHEMELGVKYALLGNNQSAINVFNKYDINRLKGYELYVYAREFFYYYVLLNKPDSMQIMLDKVGFESFQVYGKGRIYEIRNQLDSALTFYNEFQKLLPTNQGGIRRTARVQRKLKNYQEAENSLKKIFVSSPFLAGALYEMALVQWEKGEREEAWKYLNKALDVWAEADEEYIYAKRARETKKEWEKITSGN